MLERSLEEPSKFQMKTEEQFILIMWTYFDLVAYDECSLRGSDFTLPSR